MTSNHRILTKNGYILSKKKLSNDKINTIKKDLTVKPYVHPDYSRNVESFKLFEENNNNLYIPRFYAEKKIGPPKKTMLGSNNTIDIKFTGELRDYQINIAKKCLKDIKEKGGGIISLYTGAGKCFLKGTKIMLYNCSTINVEDIKIGDKLMGDDSKPRVVISLANGKELMYNVTAKNGLKYTVNESHIISLKCIDNIIIGEKYYNKDSIVDTSIKNYLKLSTFEKSKLRGYRVPINFTHQKVKKDPYLVGYSIVNNIANEYKYNSKLIRFKLLSGIIDAKGYIKDNSCYCIVLDNIDLINDIIFICRSLGLGINKYYKKQKKYYKVCIYGNINLIPTIKKKFIFNVKKKDVSTYKINITPTHIDNYYGFEIDGNRRFLLADFTVTHNTVIALYLLCKLKVKSLIVVHKTFLQNQWIERIKQFTDAKIGIIRQKKKDVKNKSIVVGMLQSIAQIDYDPQIFEEFDCIIYDEVHRVPSRVFSKALRKLGCKYTIGLSATPCRDDGLTKVLFWYIGDILCKIERKADSRVLVKIFEYNSNDKLFVEKRMKINRKIIPMIPKMLTNIGKIKARNNFIINILNELMDNKNRKILVLSHRLEQLKILKTMMDKIIKKNIQNDIIEENEYKTGFYIGGMKQYELDESSEADIIFATYAMAEEGLDIASLNTVLLSSPKRKIIQSVGRIFRKPIIDGDTYPMIIDIADQFSKFIKWENYRIEYYNKKKYTIDKYLVLNDKCVRFKEYLEINKIITNKEMNAYDIRKYYIIHQFGKDIYELEEEVGFQDDDITKYTYEPTLKNIFNNTHNDTNRLSLNIDVNNSAEDNSIEDSDNIILHAKRLKEKLI